MTIRGHKSTGTTLKRKASEPAQHDTVTDACGDNERVDDISSVQEQARMLL